MTRDEALANMRRSSSFRTICEVHREIFDSCGVLPESIRDHLQDLVIEAFIMGKKMDAKLREYKADWDNGFYEPNVDHHADSKRRKA